MNEIEKTAQRLAKAANQIADKAAELKAVADQLRADVDELAKRVSLIEDDLVPKKELEADKNVIKGEQKVQNTRLDELENGN